MAVTERLRPDLAATLALSGGDVTLDQRKLTDAIRHATTDRRSFPDQLAIQPRRAVYSCTRMPESDQ